MNSDAKSFLGFLTLGVLLATVFVVGFMAIPVAIAAGIFYWFYKKATYVDPLIELREIETAVAKKQPLSKTDFLNACYDHIKYDLLLEEVIRELYQWEQVSEAPKIPPVATSIELARFKDQAAKYANVDYTDMVPAFLDALRPFVVRSGKGIFEGSRPLKLEEVEYLSSRMNHPKYFKRVWEILHHNKEKAKTVEDYVHDTPFEYILDRPIKFDLKNRFQHTHIMAGPGAGKTQLIQYMISKDLEDDCTIIVLDNQKQMINKLARLGVQTQLITPRQPRPLNIFDMEQGHTTVSLLQYVLSSLMNVALTGKQELVFQFGVIYTLAVKGNINTFQDLLDGRITDFSMLDETARRFFETEFPTKGTAGYEGTRKEISWRIWKLQTNETLRRMFMADTNDCKLDLSKKLILIDADVDILQDYSGMFGRFFLAQIMQLSQARFSGNHKPLYVYIDECYYYLDTSVTTMLETARKANVGLILAHQYFGQIKEPRISSALMSLTSTKFAAQLSPEDAHAMARAMHTTPTFVQTQKKLNFALWQSEHDTVSIEVPAGVIEAMPQHEPPEYNPPRQKPLEQAELPAEYVPRDLPESKVTSEPAAKTPAPSIVAESGNY